MPGVRPCSAVLRGATCGRAASRTGPRPSAVFATRTAWVADGGFGQAGTDGLGGGKFTTAQALAERIASFWPAVPGVLPGKRFVVLTGGEPLMQVDVALIDALHAQGFEIAVETNGTIAAPAGLDWICVSPKAGSTLVQTSGHELKVVVPQAGFTQADLLAFEAMDFAQRRVQPMDSASPEAVRAATEWAVQWCLDHPSWLLSVQTHKTLGIR